MTAMMIYLFRPDGENQSLKRKNSEFLLTSVVISCIVKIALLLPAVQAAREAARRMTCSSHQKQDILAMHLYNDTNGTFPPGARGYYNGTWAMHIAPFIEQTAAFADYDFEKSYIDSTVINGTSNVILLNDLRVPVYSCPTDPSDTLQPLTGATGAAYYSHNYVVCMGRDGVYDLASSSRPPYVSPNNCWIDLD